MFRKDSDRLRTYEFLLMIDKSPLRVKYFVLSVTVLLTFIISFQYALSFLFPAFIDFGQVIVNIFNKIYCY